jgi:myosin heavy subunit
MEKDVYERMFKWIVGKINDEMNVRGDKGKKT